MAFPVIVLADGLSKLNVFFLCHGKYVLSVFQIIVYRVPGKQVSFIHLQPEMAADIHFEKGNGGSPVVISVVT